MQTQAEQKQRSNDESSDRLIHTLLVNCGRVLVQAADEQQLLQSFCNTLVTDCGFRMVWFGYAEPGAVKSIRLIAQAGDQDEFLKETNSSEPQGDGNGLAICRSIVETHGCRLWSSAKEQRRNVSVHIADQWRESA